MKTSTILYAAAAMMLAACSQTDEWGTADPVTLQVSATISDATTRVGVAGTTFADGDVISLFDDDATSAVAYTAGAAGQFAGNYVFQTEGEVAFTACYPAVSDNSDVTLDLTDQTDALDCLFAKGGKAAAAFPELALTFTHVMSKLTFRLSAGNGFAKADASTDASAEGEATAAGIADAEVHLVGLPSSGTFSPATGIVEALSAQDEIPAVTSASAAQDADLSVEALVLPQSEATFTLKVTIGEMDYTKRLTTPLAPGNNYIFPVTVNKRGLTVGDVSIATWDDEKVDANVTVSVSAN